MPQKVGALRNKNDQIKNKKTGTIFSRDHTYGRSAGINLSKPRAAC